MSAFYAFIRSADSVNARNAIIHEALRIHANTGMILERVVPSEGAVIDGYELPGGTLVGVNGWVIHRNTNVYGDDVDAFRPERWMEASDEKLAEMNKYLFSVRPLNTMLLFSQWSIMRHVAFLATLICRTNL